jgi:beta-phosphoglucomutase
LTLTLQELAVAPQECIAIEDSEKGIASAKEAGLEVWAMRDEHFGMDQSQADAFLTQLCGATANSCNVCR